MDHSNLFRKLLPDLQHPIHVNASTNDGVHLSNGWVLRRTDDECGAITLYDTEGDIFAEWQVDDDGYNDLTALCNTAFNNQTAFRIFAGDEPNVVSITLTVRVSGDVPDDSIYCSSNEALRGIEWFIERASQIKDGLYRQVTFAVEECPR